MMYFSSRDLEQIDRFWRQCPPGHVWSGWAAAGDSPDTVWIFRHRAHWRRFSLVRLSVGYVLVDDSGRASRSLLALSELSDAIEEVPALVQGPA